MSAKAQNWPWAVLGLESPAPEREVRRAYARCLKALDPAADPAGFEALREAYEFARMIARNRDAAPPAAAAPESGETTPPLDALSDEMPPLQASTVSMPEPPDLPSPDTPPQITLDEAIARMQVMVKERDWTIAHWHELLNAPVLDPAEASRAFERALLAAFAAKLVIGIGLDRPKMPLSRAWLELIEGRYGWKADGLHFQRSFPEMLPVRAAYLDARQQAGIDLPTDHESLPSARPDGYRFVHHLVSPAGLALFILIAILVVFPEATRSPWRSILATASFLAIAIWFSIPARWKLRRMPISWFRWMPRPTRWSDLSSGALVASGALYWLLQRSALAWVLNVSLILGSALFFAVAVVPNLRQGWIPENKVVRRWEVATQEQSLFGLPGQSQKEIVPSYDLVQRVADDVSAGRINPADALQRLQMPYPVIVAETLPGNAGEQVGGTPGDGPIPAPAMGRSLPARYACLRHGVCTLALTTGLAVMARVQFVQTSKKYDFSLDLPKIRAAWDANGKLIAPPAVLPDTLNGLVSFEGLNNYLGLGVPVMTAFSSNLDLGALRLDWPEGPALPQLSFVASRGAKGGVPLRNCDGSSISVIDRAAVSVNPRAQELISELCSIPPEVLKVSVRGAAKGGEAALGPLSWHLTSPLERFMLSLTPQHQPPAASPDPKLRALAKRISDRIIDDYLTVFWSVPIPPELRSYLQRHPEIHRPSGEPDEAALLAAADRQPQLTHLYRFRSEMGPQVLRDMFAYITEKGIVQQ